MRADRRDSSFKEKKKNHDSRKVKTIIYINHIVFKKGKLPPENIVNAHILWVLCLRIPSQARDYDLGFFSLI